MKRNKANTIFFLVGFLISSSGMNSSTTYATSKSFSLPESTSQTQTHTVTLPNLKSINSVTANTGSASVQSINGDNATFRLTGGNTSRAVQTGGTVAGSVTRTDSRTSTSNSFASSIPYDSGGYSGTLYKSGSVTSNSVENGGYWQETGYYQDTGYYEDTGYYTTKYRTEYYTVREVVWCQSTTGSSSHAPPCSQSSSSVYGDVQKSRQVSYQEWVSTGSKFVKTGSYWVSTGSYWVTTYTTYYTQNYSGTVSKPDTRTYQYYYQYNVTIDYIDNTAPVMTTANTSLIRSAETGHNIVTLQGTISDVDNDNVTISASVNGKTKSTTVSATSTAKSWTLSWNVANDNLAQGDYSNIPVTANDGKGGTATNTYTGKIIIDRTKPSISFTPEMIEPSFKDLEVQVNITDTGGAEFKHIHYAWSKNEEYPTEDWSDWETTNTPLIKQERGGKWYLHIEAEDYVGNRAYAYSGIYDKIVLSGGPSVNIHVFPTPTGVWHNKPIGVYVMESGDAEILAKAMKTYEVTNSSLYPSELNKTIPNDKKIELNLQGENFVHVQYILDDGTKVSATTGPFLIDTAAVGDFTMKLTTEVGVSTTEWTNSPLRLEISDPLNASVSGYEKQYRIEGIHYDWQPYEEGTVISVEGEHRIFGRVLNKTGRASEQQVQTSKIDYSKPTVISMKLNKTTSGQYDISVKTADYLSGVKEVRLNDGTKLTSNANGFELKNHATKPSHLTLEDQVGNRSAPVAFATEPIIAFEESYDPLLDTYPKDVVANISNATGYIIGNKGYSCTSEMCKVIIPYNTTFTAVNTVSEKETRVTVKIENIDKTTVQLLLNGKRNIMNPLIIELIWSPTLSSGTLNCFEGGNSVNYEVSGSSFNLSGKNYTYNCTLIGNYNGQTLTSNTIVVYSDGKLPTEGTTAVPMSEVTTNVYIMETKVGKGYIINAKSDNYKYNELPIPLNEVTEE